MPRKDLIVSLSGVNSICFNACIFFGSGEILFSDQMWPWKDTCFCLNWIFSTLRVRLFSIHFSINAWKFLLCSISSFPAIIMSSAIPVTPFMPIKMASSLDWKMSYATTVPIGRRVHWNLPNGKAMQVSFLESG